MIVKGDPHCVFGGEGREFLGHGVGALGGDADTAEGLGDLEVEINFLVGRTEGNFVEVNVYAGVVVELAERAALRELGGAGGGGRFFRGRQCGGFLFRPSGGDADSGELLNGAAHEVDFAESTVQNTAESFFGRGEHAAVAVSNGADPHAVEDGVGLGGRSRSAERTARQKRGGGERGGGAEEGAAGGEGWSGHGDGVTLAEENLAFGGGRAGALALPAMARQRKDSPDSSRLPHPRLGGASRESEPDLRWRRFRPKDLARAVVSRRE